MVVILVLAALSTPLLAQPDLEDLRRRADEGYVRAQYNLALMYDTGRGVPEDNMEAVRWYRKAADQGNVRAQNNLGVMYDAGEGVPEDNAEAVRWYRMAAEQGDASAQYFLGEMYALGDGVLRSGAAAADWYYKAGLAYLEEGKREDALRCVEHIRNLEAILDLTVPNMFLADQLLRAVYPKN